MPHTGQSAAQSGIYRGGCNCGREIALSKNETFPPCSGCHEAVNWTLVRPTHPNR
jgi:hypothetical protein